MSDYAQAQFDMYLQPDIDSVNYFQTNQKGKTMSETTPITEGQYLVGISFNPGGHEQVNHIKQKAAELIDYVRANGKDPRLTALCVTHLEDAAMWGVKSVTKPERPSHLR